MTAYKTWTGLIVPYDAESPDHRIIPSEHQLLFPLRAPVLISTTVVGDVSRFQETITVGHSGIHSTIYVNMYQIPGSQQGKNLYPAVEFSDITTMIKDGVTILTGGTLLVVHLVEVPLWTNMTPVIRGDTHEPRPQDKTGHPD